MGSIFVEIFKRDVFIFVKCFYAAHGYCTLCFLEKMHSVLLLDLKGIIGALSWWMVFLLDSVSSSLSLCVADETTALTCSSYSSRLEMSSCAALVALFLQNWILCSWWLNLGFGWQQCFTIRNHWDCSNLGFRGLCCPLAHNTVQQSWSPGERHWCPADVSSTRKWTLHWASCTVNVAGNRSLPLAWATEGLCSCLSCFHMHCAILGLHILALGNLVVPLWLC